MSHREGTSQTKRFITALQPDRLQLHDFSVEDWVLFAYHFGKQVHFFETTNDKVPVGTWRELFNLLEISEELPLRGTPEYQNLKSQLKALIAAFGVTVLLLIVSVIVPWRLPEM